MKKFSFASLVLMHVVDATLYEAHPFSAPEKRLLVQSDIDIHKRIFKKVWSLIAVRIILHSSPNLDMTVIRSQAVHLLRH